MRVPSPLRIATLTLLVGGLACAKNRTDETVGAARDTTAAGVAKVSDTTSNQTKSGVTDTKTGESTLGKDVTRTRPDQGQPVTSKGDTINAGVDSAANQAAPTPNSSTDTSGMQMSDSTSMNMHTDSTGMSMPADSSMSHDSSTAR